ncbi:hypothetical protein HK097_000441 [Rhizophlyctis rosea]|uniref:Uncharacterized protein n=1 Tax=Rhizophlyctis rosea TaxID=64517 RepID=A0AAD5S837_9FUNG|nr:hypothetical protein HK097_000441 [Rhizophlyctis rosea]
MKKSAKTSIGLQPPPPSASTTPNNLEAWKTWLQTHANWPKDESQIRLVSVTRVRDHQWTDVHKFAEAAAQAPNFPPRKPKRLKTRKRKAEDEGETRALRSGKKIKSPTAAVPAPTAVTNPDPPGTYVDPPHFENIYMYHGTLETNIDSITTDGYQIGQSGAVFCASAPLTSVMYCRGGKKMLLNSVLVEGHLRPGIVNMGVEGWWSTPRVQRVVPIAVIEFAYSQYGQYVYGDY